MATPVAAGQTHPIVLARPGTDGRRRQALHSLDFCLGGVEPLRQR
jgi:hypothetical protein